MMPESKRRIELDSPAVAVSDHGPTATVARLHTQRAFPTLSSERLRRLGLAGACSIPFKIVALDPDLMTIVETLYATDGAPMGAGTVGLRVGDELFIGSFHGDRIFRVNLKAQ